MVDYKYGYIAKTLRKNKIKRSTYNNRIRLGWTMEDAMTVKPIAFEKHGHSTRKTGLTRTYRIWTNMRSRSTNKNLPGAKRYSLRGIKCCKKWEKFSNFLHDMGEVPSKYHQIDRINNDRGYSKSNCRWVTHKENCRNRFYDTRIKFRGKSQCLQAWCDELGIKFSTARSRLARGAPVSVVLGFTVPMERC